MVAPSSAFGNRAGFIHLVRADHRDGTDNGTVAGISKRPEGLYLIMIAALPR